MPLKIDRRSFLGALVALPTSFPTDLADAATSTAEGNTDSVRQKLSLNADWKFLRQDAAFAERPGYDDTLWSTVSLPHTFDDQQAYNHLITDNGAAFMFEGTVWYRKTFRVSDQNAAHKVFLEFEGLRQAGQFSVNGIGIGVHEDGVSACGFDITPYVHFGDKDNVLAVRVNNTHNYKEIATETPFSWNYVRFNPNFGGLNQNAWLHITDTVYQTFPLFSSLGTQGCYISASKFSPDFSEATVEVESEVKNARTHTVPLTMEVSIQELSGTELTRFPRVASILKPNALSILRASGTVKGIHPWSPDDPHLYNVVTTLRIGEQIVDVVTTKTGFRAVEFKGGAGTGGVYINGKFTYLKGYSQRSTNEWPAVGQAYPNWMHDYSMEQFKNSHANHVRWMHVAPMRQDVLACDTHGIVQSVPAGDWENDAHAIQWTQRANLMRATIIAYRNNPSVLFWEAGNNGISATHMKEMHALRLTWDPRGGRAMGCRTLKDPAALPFAEYFGTMIGQGYSNERRDRGPILETENCRDEAARRFWDIYSPPYFEFQKAPADAYGWDSETFCFPAVREFYKFASQSIQHTDPAKAKWSGYASIIFSDTVSHGRQLGSEVCRVSGKTDGMRIHKQVYFAHRVMHNTEPDIHIIGHWTYPEGTVKTVYVVSNCPSVALYQNDKLISTSTKPWNGYLFYFENIPWSVGSIKAVAMRDKVAVCSHSLTTVKPPTAITVTPIMAPTGFRADGSDVALFDIQIVDEDGNRCPTDEDGVDFVLDGPAQWKGGYNSGIVGTIGQKRLNTECGITRVAIRSLLVPGKVTLTASRVGIASGSASIVAIPVRLLNGLLLDDQG